MWINKTDGVFRPFAGNIGLVLFGFRLFLGLSLRLLSRRFSCLGRIVKCVLIYRSIRTLLCACAGGTVGLGTHHFLQLIHGLQFSLVVNFFFTLFLKHDKRCGSTGCTGKAGQQQTCFHLGRIFHGIHSLSNDAELLS